ncbi:MAG TPA: hypothetical protein VGR56_09755, partial [Nitrososphaerales archaeon]|nr:hypothetical protein [Nitrososphaerales archaeon]
MTFSQLLVIFIGGIMISTIVVLILLFYFQERRDAYPTNSAMFIARLKQRMFFRNFEAFANFITRRNNGTKGSAAFTKPYGSPRDPSGSDSQNSSSRPIEDLYRRIG